MLAGLVVTVLGSRRSHTEGFDQRMSNRSAVQFESISLLVVTKIKSLQNGGHRVEKNCFTHMFYIWNVPQVILVFEKWLDHRGTIADLFLGGTAWMEVGYWACDMGRIEHSHLHSHLQLLFSLSDSWMPRALHIFIHPDSLTGKFTHCSQPSMSWKSKSKWTSSLNCVKYFILGTGKRLRKWPI